MTLGLTQVQPTVITSVASWNSYLILGLRPRFWCSVGFLTLRGRGESKGWRRGNCLINRAFHTRCSAQIVSVFGNSKLVQKKLSFYQYESHKSNHKKIPHWTKDSWLGSSTSVTLNAGEAVTEIGRSNDQSDHLNDFTFEVCSFFIHLHINIANGSR